LFILLSIVMAAIAGATRQPTTIDTSLAGRLAQPQQQQRPQQAQPVQPVTAPNPATSPGTATQNKHAPAVPLAQ